MTKPDFTSPLANAEPRDGPVPTPSGSLALDRYYRLGWEFARKVTGTMSPEVRAETVRIMYREQAGLNPVSARFKSLSGAIAYIRGIDNGDSVDRQRLSSSRPAETQGRLM
jgi:hypothetical protein